MIEQLQETATEAQQRQHKAEEERDHLRRRLSEIERQLDHTRAFESQVKELAREKDMLLKQQNQYGPLITDLKQKIKAADVERHEIARQRDALVRQRDLATKDQSWSLVK